MTGLSPLRGVDALPEDTIVSFIVDGVAQEVKRRVDLKAAAMTTEEDLQLCLKLSFSTTPFMWLHVGISGAARL